MSQQNNENWDAFYEQELNKINDPISGEYYFYLNYTYIKDKDGNDIPKMSEEQFLKEYEKIKEQKVTFYKYRRTL